MEAILMNASFFLRNYIHDGTNEIVKKKLFFRDFFAKSNIVIYCKCQYIKQL